ncbi:MAG: phospho-N-acetylmuramoyl-pentapeptide-transferase [Omnitrophica bacterium RIFCSPLOWO2_02_FULL_45_16]|nr:MAG: phospho-N-acetylmuramoyl-pentapeptide-transferase [Omnitrophica bacterium RIFCSPHIGHO2_02_FULL_46_20]OGW92969.1 MAG: phospho-N-acetylmuramoyl-pentapeptide-transferase [Omnitrophica bacterium RIFCSPLOWO2_12_FULL_45_13]OGW94426.1 MAG: phospho-N-acetylmuramoyl-pentapeptide-transferase [Omnitrophica bacterium RIFCSPLOWO2_01_FULL_45_24]OGX00337.1 MAG: phospho-N-acetylmuramoyl-pentapeptide-transferase [Omnitrophica bacterium RIFCSPLOWO2_02_FULL_45_16]
MLYYLFYSLRDYWFGFNVFKYITFRAAMASLTALLISLIFGPVVIRRLKELSFGQHIRKEYVEFLYDLTKHKQGTPTMGGVLIIIAIALATILWADILNRYILMTLGSFLFLGLVGFADDYIKVVKKRSMGLRPSRKFLSQAFLALIIATFVIQFTPIPTTLNVPFIKFFSLELGALYLVFVVIVITGASNAVNLTDGLDGLAIGCTIIAALAYSVLTYITGNFKFADYLNVFHLQGAGELSVFCAAMVGAGLGFLWFNSYPANVFMGDTGSLALGGALGVIAVFIKKELLLFLVGGIFVIEAASVLLQVLWLKTTKKRLFLMSPIHHHFQLRGWPESKITIRFWIVAIVLALLSLATLKLQ